MLLRRFSQISLAAKCRLLFGSAVVLIVSAALFIPWYQTERLWDELNVRTAKQIAMLALSRIDAQAEDLSLVRKRLKENWPDIAREADLPESIIPEVVPVPNDPSRAAEIEDDFIRLSFAEFGGYDGAPAGGSARRVAQRTERDPTGRRIYRYAVAIRKKLPSDLDPKGSLLGTVVVTLPDQEIENRLFYRVVVLGAGILAGALAILVFYSIMQGLILSPVRRLRRVADKVSAGDITVRSTIQTGDEFERLSRAFNTMLERLCESHDELRKINRSLDMRLGELAETNVSLFEANRLKSEFLANVSHELRTPLASIIGFAELLQETPDPDERVMRYASHIHSSGRMLLNIINDLLDLAKIEAGKMDINRTRFSLYDICDSVIEFTRPLADKKQLHLEFQAEPGLPKMNSDSGKIQQVLYNLVSNAIKFTPDEGSVRIMVDRQDEHLVRIGVMDTGPGIPPEQQQTIFEKFRQLDSSVTREHGGTGLGLAISRELVQILGGTISVESEPGNGAHFLVALPIESPAQTKRPLVALT